MYPTAGLGIDFVQTKVPLTLIPTTRTAKLDPSKLANFRIASPDLAAQLGGASNLMLGGAVVGVGLLTYLIAKSLKK